MAKSMSHQAKLALDAALPFDGSSEAYEFISETLQQTISQLASEGIRGTRSRHGERVIQGQKAVSGSIVLQPTQAELDLLLPRILGANESTDVFDVAEALPEFYAMVDRVGKVFTYGPLKIGSAVFTGSENNKIDLTLNVVGRGSETIGNAGTFPSISIDTDLPLAFHQGTLTLQGNTLRFNSFTLTIENGVEARFENSQSAIALVETDRVVTLELSAPYTADSGSDGVAVYGADVAGTVASGTLVFAPASGRSVTFSLNSLRPTTRSPNVPGRNQEIRVALSYQAMKTSSTNEISVTNDRTA